MLDFPDAGRRAEAIEAMGRRVPEALLPPDIPEGFEGWLAEFFELSTDRTITEAGVGPIPAASIARQMADIAPGEQDAFRHIIRALDAAYIARANGQPQHDPDAPVSDNPLRDAFRRGG